MCKSIFKNNFYIFQSYRSAETQPKNALPSEQQPLTGGSEGGVGVRVKQNPRPASTRDKVSLAFIIIIIYLLLDIS